MDQNQRDKLERYFRNANRFLWGLSRENQKNTYPWLSDKGYDIPSRTSYADATDLLLANYGIEALLGDLIVPRVEELFTAGALDFLRTCWQNGIRPDIHLTHAYNMKDAYPFLKINLQYNYVEGWGTFAGLWFEEIEPLGKV